MVQATETALRPASTADLTALNAVVETAVMGWNLPERVKRLALPSYRYQPHDLGHLQLWVAESHGKIVGVAALEPADSRELPAHKRGLLLHGLYVHPDYQHQGIGTQLLEHVQQQAAEQGLDGLLVRAQNNAGGFFASHGMELLGGEDDRNYQFRYWKAV